MATATLVRPAQTMRAQRDPPRPASTLKRSLVNGSDFDHTTSKKRRLEEPFVRDSDYILEKHKGKPPSLVMHLHPTHFRFDGQDGSFAYDSPMRFVIEHLRKQTVPHEMMEEFWAENVPFYDGCLIVEVHNHRIASGGSERSKRSDATGSTQPVKFSMHNYNDHVTSSPFVPYPVKAKEDIIADISDSITYDGGKAPRKSKDQRGPKITTLVLHPTALSRYHDIRILANTPLSDVRSKRKGDGSTSSSAATKNAAQQAQKMCLDESDFYSFQSDLLVATEPPLYLDPVKSLAESEQLLMLLTNPLHCERPPSPKTRKRTTAEMAADDAQAAEEERRMLIMDERIKASGTGISANDNQAAAASLGFSRFKTLEMVRQKHEEQERAKKEEEARVALERKQNEEHAAQQQKLIQATRQRELAQQVQQRQASLMMQQNQQRPEIAMQQFAEAQRQAQMARNDVSQNMRNQAQAANFHHQQQQQAAAAMSPVSRQQTPMVASSPIVRMAQTNSQGAGSPPRPPSAAMQHHNAAAMARQVSQQQHASQNNTPQMASGTPNMAQAIPNRQVSQTPRMQPGSPANAMQGNATPQNMVMQTPHMANAPSQLTPAQVAMLQTQRALSQVQSQQGMQPGSLPQGMTPEQIQNIRAQQQAQAHAKQQAILQAQAAAQAGGNPQLAAQQAYRANMMRQAFQHQQMRQMQQMQQQQQTNGQAAGALNADTNGAGGMVVQNPQMAGNMPQTPLQQNNMMPGQGNDLTPQQQHAMAQVKAQQMQMHRQSQQQLQHLSQQYGGWMNIPQNVVTTLTPQMQMMLRQQAQKQQFIRQQQAQRAQQQLQQGGSGGDQQVPAGQPNPQYMQALRSNQAMLMQAQAQMRQNQQQQQQQQQQNGVMNGMGVNMNMANMGAPNGFGGGQAGADLNQHFANMQNALNSRAGQQGMNGGVGGNGGGG